MSQAKDAPDEPCGDGPARASKKSYAKPDHNQLKIDLRRHLNVSPQPGCNDRPQHSMRCHSIPDALPHGMPDERNRAGFFGFSICQGVTSHPVLCAEDLIDHPSYSIARCREVIAVAVSQIDGDPIVCDRLVDPALEITVAHIEEIVTLQCAGRRYPMAHENGEDLTANVLVGKSVRHRSPRFEKYSPAIRQRALAVR